MESCHESRRFLRWTERGDSCIKHKFVTIRDMTPFLRLPDWAVVDITKKGDINLPTASVGPVGFFNETWQLQGAAN